MAFGYLQQNLNGFVQVDDTYKNLAVIASGTGTTGTAVTFAAQAAPPLVAIGVCGPAKFCQLSSVTTSTFVITSYAQAGNFTFSYKVYAPPSTVMPGGQYGLRVFNSAGERTFDSNLEYLGTRFIQKVAGTQLNVSTPGTYSPSYSVNHGLGGSPFVIMNGTFMPSRTIMDGFRVYVGGTTISASSNTVVDIGERTLYNAPFSEQYMNQRTTATMRIIVGY